MLVLMIVAVAGPARAADWEWRAAAGAQIDPSSHGVVDFGVRKGPWSIQLLTDTLDLRWAPESDRGRWWIAARGEAFAAGLLITPWTRGAPDPTRALTASYGGLEGGFLRYFGPVYLGAQLAERGYVFGAREQTAIPVPGITSLLSADFVAGYYQPSLHVWVRAGIDLQDKALSAHVAGEGVFRPAGLLAPRLEVRAGWGFQQTDLTRTRLGGLNPYVVPLAGAGWAEFWVENYAAGRAGLTLKTKHVEAGVLVDAAAFEGTIATGLAGTVRGTWRRWFAEATVGWAPGIPRQDGVWRVAMWALIGTDWGRFGAW